MSFFVKAYSRILPNQNGGGESDQPKVFDRSVQQIRVDRLVVLWPPPKLVANLPRIIVTNWT